MKRDRLTYWVQFLLSMSGIAGVLLAFTIAVLFSYIGQRIAAELFQYIGRRFV